MHYALRRDDPVGRLQNSQNLRGYLSWWSQSW